MAFTDYSTACGELPQSLIQMLANTIVGYDDEAGIRHFYINVIGDGEHCDDLHDLLDCNTNAIEPERQLVENIFALDECGRLAVKLFINQGEE